LIQNDFVSSLYLDSYYHKKYREIRKESISDKYLEFMALRAASQNKFIVKNISKIINISSVLDIGASAGKLLETFKDQAALYAVESDLVMRDFMRQTGFISIIDESELFANNKYDLITMSHVFEHINNPLEYLYRLHKIVSQDGFVLIEIPNEPVHLVTHNVDKKRKGIGHLFDYTIDTFKQMIAKSNLFDVVALTTFSVSVDEYIKGASIRNFEENEKGDGIHIRALLQRKSFLNSMQEHHYIDAALQNQYRKQLIAERRNEILLLGLEKIRHSLLAAKSLLK